MIDISALEALEKAATAGPWGRNPMLKRDQVRTGDLATIDESGSGFIADCRSRADLEFIVAARNALPTLLAELRAARAVIEAAKSVAAEDVVKDSLLCFVMGGELLDRLDAYDTVTEKE